MSTDGRLLGAFAAAFLLAVGVAALSIVLEKANLAYSILMAVLSVGLILLLFRYAYRRALFLINPLQQLAVVLQDTSSELQSWSRKARRAAPLLETQEDEATDPSSDDPSHDLARAVYFRINRHWTDGAKRGIRHAMSFARRYAEQGDYEVSAKGLMVTVAINGEYVKAKGRTFYDEKPFIENR